MTIGIDASRLDWQQQTGTESVSQSLLGRLFTFPEAKEHSFVLFMPAHVRRVENIPHVQVHRVPAGRPWVWFFSRELRRVRKELDVLFVPSHIVPFFLPKRTVTMIHGLEWDSVPWAYSRGERCLQQMSLSRAIRTCDTILTPSAATKRHLVAWAQENRLPLQRVVVVPHGAPSLSPAAEHLPEWMRGLQDAPFLLFVGRHDHRKNLLRLIRAFRMLRPLFPELRLVLAGGAGSATAEIQEELGGQDVPVLVPGYVEEEEKTWLLQHAAALVYPSLAEGFGLPLLEAFQAECPVVASDISVFREVAQDAALFVDPTSEEDIAFQLENLLRDNDFQRRLTKKGIERASLYTWEESARKTLQILTEMVD